MDVVVVAAESPRGHTYPAREGVQLFEAGVADHVAEGHAAPLPVGAVDQDRHVRTLRQNGKVLPLTSFVERTVVARDTPVEGATCVRSTRGGRRAH